MILSFIQMYPLQWALQLYIVNGHKFANYTIAIMSQPIADGKDVKMEIESFIRDYPANKDK